MKKEIEDNIILLYNRGMFYKEIAKTLSISYCYISKTLKKYNIKKRPTWNKGLNKKIDDRIKIPKTAFKSGQVPWNKGIPWNEGIPWNDTMRKKLSIAHIGQVSNKKGKTLEEIYSPEIAKKIRNQLRINGITTSSKLNRASETSIERKIENYLLFNEIIYIKQYPYKLGVADFWLPESNLIIECDGDYWHNLPGYKERDKRQTNWLEDNDYITLRFKEYDINNNFNFVQNKIINYI